MASITVYTIQKVVNGPTTVRYQNGKGGDLFPIDLSFEFTPQDDAAACLLADAASKLIEQLVERRLRRSEKKE